MGTIVTACMLLGLICAVPYAVNTTLKPMPRVFSAGLGGLVFLAGAWNTFWHGIRNLTDFWGLAALISGVFMMVTALYIMRFASLPQWLQRSRVVVLLGLLVWFLVYAVTIARL